jgi:hypothetical protein
MNLAPVFYGYIIILKDGVCQHNDDLECPLSYRNGNSVVEVHDLMQCNARFAICEMAEEVEFCD